MKLTQNQYYGLKSNLPSFLKEGSVYLCSDTKEMFIYIEGDIPFKLVEGEKDVITRDELNIAIDDIKLTDYITVVPNYSFLPDPTSVGDNFYYVNESQGTQWLPGTIGGSYYPKGIYYSNGISWSYVDSPYQSSQSEVDAGIENIKFITPLTLATYNRWATKYDASNPAGYISNANLTYVAGASNGTVVSENGTDVIIPIVNFTSAGLMTSEEKKLLYNISSTGVTKFGGLSINTDNTKYNVGIVEGWFVDNTSNVNNPSKVFKSFPTSLANVLPNIATQNVTYVAIDINGLLQLSSNPFTPEKQRDCIPLGLVAHSNRINVNAINNQPVVAINVNNQLSDLIESIGFFNIYGNVFTYNGANLSINKSSGEVYKQGANFINNNKDPNTLNLIALVAPNNIRYRTQTGIEFVDTAFIDAGFYDLNGVRTAIPGTRWSIQRIYLFQSNLVRIQYGQDTYTSKTEAIQGINSETFISEQNILENGLFRGLLIVREGATDLSDPNRALFISASKFGSVAGLGSLSTTSLQQAYNNSIEPEITTNSALGALAIKRGSTLDTDNVVEVLNGSSIVTALIKGNGDISASKGIFSSGVTANDNSTINGTAVGDTLYLQKSSGASLALSGSTGTTNNVLLQGSNTINPNLEILTGGALRQTITSTGNVLINTSTDNGIDKVQVGGTISASPATLDNQVVVKSQLDLKVDKVTGKSLISDTEITRLSTVSNVDISGKENITNKASTLTASAILYPNNNAVIDGLATRSPVSGSGNYIQNQNANAQSANMWISGQVKVSGVDTPISVFGIDNSYIKNTSIGTDYDASFTSYDGTNTVGSGLLASSGGAVGAWSVYNNGIKLSIAPTGAATFSSSVTASNGQLIGGTGTANFIPKWTGAGTQGNSSISQSASGNLTVVGGAGADVLYLEKPTGASVALSGATGTTNKVSIAATNSTNPDLQVYTGGTERVRVLANGNVGIGTNTPSEKLSVVGGNISLGAGYKLQYSSNAYMTPENNVNGAEIATGGVFTIKTGGTTERFRIDGSGNVGIGTITPSAKLSVMGAVPANTYMLIDNASSGINYYAANNYHEFQTAGVTRLIISNTGAATFSSSITAKGLISYRIDGGVGLEVNGGDLGSGSIIANFKDFSNNPKVTITGDGRLGVGTSQPLVNVHVKDSTAAAYFRIQGVNDGDNFGALELWNGDGSSKWQFAHKSIAGETKDFSFAHFNGTSWSVPLTLKNNGEINLNGLTSLKSYTVATLPATTSLAYATVTDALAPTYLGVLTGGGTVKCPVFFNGTNWVSH